MALRGFLIFVVLLAVAQAWGARAVKKLSKKDRLRLVEVLIHFAKIGMVPLLAVSLLYWALLFFIDKIGALLIYAYFIILLAHVIALFVFVMKKLTHMNFPKSYVRDASIGLTIQYFGLASLFGGILLELWYRQI
jgi:hypothetical protein